MLTFASVFLHDFAGMGTLSISASLAAVQTGAMVMRVWSGRYTDRHGNRRSFLRLCSMTSAVGFAALGLLVLAAAATPGAHAALIPAIAVLLVIAGISVSAWHGVAYTELATLAGASRAGTALGLANSFVFIAFFVVPTAIPALLLVWSWPGVWLVGALCALSPGRSCCGRTDGRRANAVPFRTGSKKRHQSPLTPIKVNASFWLSSGSVAFLESSPCIDVS